MKSKLENSKWVRQAFSFGLDVYYYLRTRRFKGKSLENVFSSVYEKNYWGKTNYTDGPKSVSGRGSNPAQTGAIREQLPPLFTKLGVKSIFDAPCGDFNWMKDLNYSFERYVGGEIVKDLAEKNQKDFATPARHFIHFDVTADLAPTSDLILCRDCWVHLPFDKVRNSIEQFKKSGSTYLLATTFPRTKKNSDVTAGGWRALNLELPPFNFPPPIRLINENCPDINGLFSDKSLGLWVLKDLP